MNKVIFNPSRASVPKVDIVNEAGGTAYAMSPKLALAQMAMTGCFNGTYYASGKEQLETVLELCSQVDLEFIAKCAVAARTQGYMKDMPAFLTAYVAVKEAVNKPSVLFDKIFPLVIDNGKMLRNFMTFIRSGVLGRKSFGSRIKRYLRQWLENRSPEVLFRASVGNDPSMKDILRMLHPAPKDSIYEALYGYLVGMKHDVRLLPDLVKEFEAFKKGQIKKAPKVPFQMLTGVELLDEVWAEIARNAGWTMTRMNLNTFARHNVLKDKEIVDLIVERLKNRKLIAEAKAFPYQLLVVYLNAKEDVPIKIKNALQDAMEIATENVPIFKGNIVICPDVSGSMSASATGNRGSATSKIRCIDVAGLFTSAILRKNNEARVIPFAGEVVPIELNAKDTVITNAEKLVEIGGGSTCCSAPLKLLNKEKQNVDAVIFISDSESWVETCGSLSDEDFRVMDSGTEFMIEWSKIKRRCKNAKLVCIDVVPNTTSQVESQKDILLVGGFSDKVFDVIADFVNGEPSSEFWVDKIEALDLEKVSKKELTE